MTRTIEIIIHADKITALDFLKDNPTLVLQNGKYFKFIYFEPTGAGLASFNAKGLMVRLFDNRQKNTNWEVVRDITPQVMKSEPFAILQELEAGKLNEVRENQAIELKGWLFDLITNGIYTKEETALFIRLLFLHGYSFDQVTQLYSSIVKRVTLNKYFLENMKIMYKGVSI